MRGVWLAVIVAAGAGCGDSGSEYVEGRGLPVAPPEQWTPQDRPTQSTDDPSRTVQLREYDKTRLSIGGQPINVLVADTPEKRREGLSFVNARMLEGAGMLFQLPDGIGRLDLSELKVGVDVVLGGNDRIVTEVGSDSKVADRAGTKYVLILPSGEAARLKLAPGQSIEMGGGVANAL